MKSDSTQKSVIKNKSETKISNKKNLVKESQDGITIKNQVNSEKNIKNEIENLDLDQYPIYLSNLLNQSDWIKQNESVDILKNYFENKFKIILEKKKNEFNKDGGNEIDFHFSPAYKREFYDLLQIYKKKKNQHFKEISNKQRTNLCRKKEIIDEIKKLIDESQHDNNTYKNFKNLQEAFHNTGQVPRNDNNNIWQTYKFHVERFYDLLHLNRELRDIDYQNNYQEKVKIIDKAEKLADMENIHRAIRELNNLHRLWKNELGPVAREKREDLWKRFQIATKKIHDKKNKYNKNIDSIRLENYKTKVELIDQIKKESEKKKDTHNKWQNSIKEVEELKKKFIAAGNVPKEKNKDLWNSFRDVTKVFNRDKNTFYKNLKVLEKKSVISKHKLIAEVENILNKQDWRNHIDRIKEIQTEWKSSGRVSRKYSDKLWSEFKSKINSYFSKYKNQRRRLNDNEIKIVEDQKKFIEDLKKDDIPLTPKKYEAFTLEKSLAWNQIRSDDIGNQEKFVLKFLTEKWNEITISKNKLELKKYETKLNFIKNDERLINDEQNSLRKKIGDISSELNQLENNLEFFSESRTNNPLLIEVNNKIKELSAKKVIIESKIKQLKSLLNQNLNEEKNKQNT